MLSVRLKQFEESIPEQLGGLVSLVPFRWRLGRAYRNYEEELQLFSRSTNEERSDLLVSRMRRIALHAYQNIEFYRRFYDMRGFDPNSIRNLDDVGRIPIIRKGDLQKWSLEERSCPSYRGIRSNTGGTSGQPLVFYREPNVYAREWAHMHHIWARFGYKPWHKKLTIRGFNIGSVPIRYNAAHNEYRVNMYANPNELLTAILELCGREKIRYVHGYPSAIYEFCCLLTEHEPIILDRLKRDLRGVFLGSEYPAPQYREVIEGVLGVDSVSWYGHSEAAILAYEADRRYEYVPYHSYGFAEAVRTERGFELVGTSYMNFVCPLVRYSTGDLIEPLVTSDGVLERFRISDGRIGEFITDRNGRRISLTGLIFGRHHKIFEVAKFVQVSQPGGGRVNLYVSGGEINQADLHKFFEFDGVMCDFAYEKVDVPFRTKAGKLPLLITFDREQ